MANDFHFEPKRVTRFFIWATAILTLGHLTGLFCVWGLGRPTVFGLVKMFHFNYEGNIPSFYSALILLVCALLFALIALSHRNAGGDYVKMWWGLVFVFIFLGIDEATEIHERFLDLREVFGTSGLLRYAWVIPYGIAVIAFGFLYLRFFLHLPRPTRKGLLIAAALYIGGAVVMEMLGGLYVENYMWDTLPHQIIMTVEELGEMAGVVVLINTLTTYIATELKGVRISVGATP